MTELLEESKRVLDEADLLCTPQEVAAAFDHIAEAMSQTVGDKNPLLLPIMNGSLVPADLGLSSCHTLPQQYARRWFGLDC